MRVLWNDVRGGAQQLDYYFGCDSGELTAWDRFTSRLRKEDTEESHRIAVTLWHSLQIFPASLLDNDRDRDMGMNLTRQ